MFNATDLIMAEETGLEVARSMPKLVPEKKNDGYMTAEIPLSVAHDCYSIDIPLYFDSVNFARFKPAPFAYKYRINHDAWIDVVAAYEVEVEDFEINALAVSNEVGLGVLEIYLEGLQNNANAYVS